MISLLKKLNIFVFIFLLISNLSFADEHKKEEGKKEEFNPGEMIMHHVGDSHEWEFAQGVIIPLPVILYSSERGLEVFSSSL